MGTHFVPMAIPETCCLTEPLNLKKNVFEQKFCHIY